MAHFSELPSYHITLRKLARNTKQHKWGPLYSLGLHLILLILGIYGLPLLWSKPLPVEYVVSVEMLKVSKKTNLKPKFSSSKKEAEKPKAAAPTPPEALPEPKPPIATPEKREAPTPPDAKAPDSPPEVIAKDTPAETKPTPPKPPAARPAKRPAPPKEETEVKKKSEPEEFDALLKTLEEAANAKSSKQSKEKSTPDLEEPDDKDDPKSRSESDFDPDQELSVSYKDSIRSQLAKCWSLNSGAQDVGSMNVTLRITLENDGTVIGIKKVGGRPTGNIEFYRAFVDSAFRAVQKCSPLKGLPKDLYRSWREIDFIFDPRDMIY